MKVENMTNNKGKSAPNQFIIRTGTEIVFQSYNIEDLEKKIIALRHTTPKIKI